MFSVMVRLPVRLLPSLPSHGRGLLCYFLLKSLCYSQKGKLSSEFREPQKSLHPVASQTSFTCFPRQLGMAGPAHTYTALTFPMHLSSTREEGQDHHRYCLKAKAHAEKRI